jgi:hypothetical protein
MKTSEDNSALRNENEDTASMPIKEFELLSTFSSTAACKKVKEEIGFESLMNEKEEVSGKSSFCLTSRPPNNESII